MVLITDYGTKFVKLLDCFLDIGNYVCPVIDNVTSLKGEMEKTQRNRMKIFQNPKYSSIKNEIEENMELLGKRSRDTILKHYPNTENYVPSPANATFHIEHARSPLDSFEIEAYPRTDNYLGFRHTNKLGARIRDSGSGTPLISVSLDSDFTYSGSKADYLKGVSEINDMGNSCVASIDFFPKIKDLALISPIVERTLKENNSWSIAVNLREENDKRFAPDGSRIANYTFRTPHADVMLVASSSLGPGSQGNIKADYNLELPIANGDPRKALKIEFPEEEKQLIKDVINRLAPI